MKLATWNVNNVVKRLPLLLAWLEATAPDVVALQELKVTGDAFPREALEAAGYASLVVGQKTWNGVALLCRHHDPIEVRRALPGDDADHEARYIEAAIGGVIVAGLYAPNGNPYPGTKFDRKLAWMERLRLHAAQLWKTGHPVVLMGDYNVVPTAQDVYATTSYDDNALVQAPVRKAYARLLKQGWTDALASEMAKQHGTPDAFYTFWDYRRQRWQRNAGMRIDHVLLSRVLKPRLVGAGIDKAVRGMDDASDHAPVWVELAD